MNLPPQAPPLTILIAEDDPMMQLGLSQALDSHPQLTVVAQVDDGYLALEAVRNLKPRIVVMDIGLPRMDGITATQKIREAFPGVRVVMLTSHTSDTEVIAALASGADGYCIKGPKLDQLVAAILAAHEGATYLDPQIARQVIHHLRAPNPPQEQIGQLSRREQEVLKLIVDGYSNTEIAAALYLSPNTIKTHIRGIMNKLAVDDRVQAAVVALRNGLV